MKLCQTTQWYDVTNNLQIKVRHGSHEVVQFFGSRHRSRPEKKTSTSLQHQPWMRSKVQVAQHKAQYPDQGIQCDSDILTDKNNTAWH